MIVYTHVRFYFELSCGFEICCREVVCTERTGMAGGMAGKKRKSEWDVSEAEESVGAAVHGVVTQLSP